MRLLVVEDEVRMASMLKRGLEEEGYSTDVAPDGIDGLRLGTENPYDAIVLDVNLPGIDGFEVCRRRYRSRDLDSDAGSHRRDSTGPLM